MNGRTLKNRYRILELIGEGSTAVVYKALDEHLGRTVAIKMLLPHVRENVQLRFNQEAKAVAALQHPNIMMIYDIVADAGAPFLVIEFVEGQPLTAFIPSPAPTVAGLGAQIADALQYAHERGIIHRDIKPANIKVTAQGQVKIMDLGLALPPEAKRVTAEGMIIGTPAYLSPEQAQAFPLDARTDIYSLGVVLYEMASGILPFNNDDIGTLMLQHVREAPPRIRDVAPDVPIALETAILKALEKQPNRRYSDAAAFASALRAAVAGERTIERPTQPAPAVNVSSGEGIRATLRVLLADDHTVLRKGLASLLMERDQFLVVGEAADGMQAVELVQREQPDVILLDLNMPVLSGMDAIPRIRQLAPRCKILVLTGRNEEYYIVQALRAGAHGYLLKTTSEPDLLDGIRKVAQGTLVLGAGVAEKVVGGMLRGGNLGETERRVLALVAADYDNEQIAEKLATPLAEVIELLALAMNKLGARDRYSAALLAIRSGYIPLDELQTL
jgi:DNA-binding NarL/FixJ family response regulator/tRNA A-37 threonylcarbamoyl transferase component Bud32